MYSRPDYRYKWFLGILYATSIKPFEAIDQFEYVESGVPEEKLHPLFWEDYAYAGYLDPSTRRMDTEILRL